MQSQIIFTFAVSVIVQNTFKGLRDNLNDFNESTMQQCSTRPCDPNYNRKYRINYCCRWYNEQKVMATP